MARKKTASVCAPRRSCIIGAFGAATLLLGVLQLLGAFQEVLRGDRGGADRAALDTRGPAAPSEPKPQSAEETPKLPPPGAAAAARSRSEPSPKAVEAVCRCMQNGSAAPPRGYKAQELLDALEMMLVELRFSLRIFSYPVDVSDCIGWKTKQGGYMLDKIIYHRVQASRMRTMSPVAASIFYIPTFTHCWRDQVENHVQGGLVAAMRMRTLLSNITRDFDYADFKKRHFWVSTHDMGKPEVLSFVGEDFAASASALVNTADALDRHKMYDPGKVGNGTMIKVRSPYAFDPRSDVALACNGRVERAEEARKRARKPREPRKYSVFFAGKAGGGRWAAKVRSAVLESLKKAPLVDGGKRSQKSCRGSCRRLGGRCSWRRIWSPRITRRRLLTATSVWLRGALGCGARGCSRPYGSAAYRSFWPTPTICLEAASGIGRSLQCASLKPRLQQPPRYWSACAPTRSGWWRRGNACSVCAST
eukprot:TRINITY_DN25978_c0_g1_i2.p1 TRINITY_DN25978_c0_g1~~TRINITY_DN25978_c0_g1_i2.p1  ORF type:complete len:477 (-),score=82.73 TRINITY_DN25978_c0_g1_i2:309-1739(-)